MRTLLTLGAIVTAMLVPWSSLAPTWLPDAAGSPVSPSSTQKYAGPAARLNPALGIMPLSFDDATESQDDPGAAYRDGRRVVCENGVCRVVDELFAKPTAPAAVGESDTVAHETRLQSLGATQLRLERNVGGDDSRVACFVPVTSGSRVLRRFESVGATDSEALTRLIEQIEAWLDERH